MTEGPDDVSKTSRPHISRIILPQKPRNSRNMVQGRRLYVCSALRGTDSSRFFGYEGTLLSRGDLALVACAGRSLARSSDLDLAVL